MRPKGIICALILVLVTLSSCTTRPPTIAHVHIGHALTGWVETPDSKGFFVVAEKNAQIAYRSAI